MPTYMPVKGMRDLLPGDARAIVRIMGISRRLAELYGYDEVILPTIESYELFAAKSGGEIKERMYVFTDLGGRRVVLRPEATASIARVFASKLVAYPRPLRLFYIINAFRYDEPQKGRYREFWQAGYELLGSGNPLADAEILELAHRFMDECGLTNHGFKVGHMGVLRGLLGAYGVPEEVQDEIAGYIDRGQWGDAKSIMRSYSDELVGLISRLAALRGRVEEVTPKARNLVEGYGEAAKSLDNLEEVLNYAWALGVPEEIVTVNMGFARGLAYYTGMIFEVKVPSLRVSLAGGGRYDKLISLFGGPETPATGFAVGIDRVYLAQREEGVYREEERVKTLVVATSQSPDVISVAAKALKAIRGSGLTGVLEVGGRSLKKTLSKASELGYRFVVIVGPREVERGVVSVRDMVRRVQDSVNLSSLPQFLAGSVQSGG